MHPLFKPQNWKFSRESLPLLGRKVLIFIGLTAFLIFISSPSLQAETVESPVKIFPLPASPFDVQVENANKVWFTLPTANKIGSLEILSASTPEQYLYTFYTPPTPNSEPYRLAIDEHNVWFTQRQGNRIGRLSKESGSIVEYEIPTPNSEPTGIDIAPNGYVWFVQNKGNKIASLIPANGTIQEINVGYGNANLDRIDATASSIVWVTAPGINYLLGYRPAFNDIVTVSVVDNRPGGGPGTVSGLAVTSTGVPWISTKNLPKLAVYMYGTLATWLWYSYPWTTAELTDIDLWIDSNQTFLWALDGANREVVQIDATTTRVVQRIGLGREISILASLDFEPTTQIIWVSDVGASALYALQPPYHLAIYLPVIAR
ncbi:hypothetical protein FKZ61_006240 [Litorilinea aerophila]|uniref:YncE family protein n=1 Tax=Litorilinea aerophila TaxID=1204385 RepID=A0A540VJ95_9CHLR|nr:hypothetical protein [Litorilinea aerophila]MCC9075713.1 hypothetical protein [Litorilinea aerophila]